MANYDRETRWNVVKRAVNRAGTGLMAVALAGALTCGLGGCAQAASSSEANGASSSAAVSATASASADSASGNAASADAGSEGTDASSAANESAEGGSAESAASADGQASSKSASSSSASTDAGVVATDTDESRYELDYSDRDKDASYDASSAVKVELAGDTANVQGEGVTVDGSTITVTAAGVYILSGTLDDGQVVVNAPEDAKVQLVLDGAHVTNADGSAIYVMQADKCFVTLADGSENSLADGNEYSFENGETEPDATLFAACDLTLQGTGKLAVTGNYNDAVKTKDDLVVTGGTYEVTAKADGLVGKDSVKVADGALVVKATEGDGVKSSKDDDASKGFVSIDGGTHEIDAGDKGVNATTYLRIAGGTLDVTAANDALHCDGSASVHDGAMTISSGDDALHVEYVLDVNGGTIDVKTCVEGFEGQVINVNGGTNNIVASDDGVNASSPESTKADNSQKAAQPDAAAGADSASSDGSSSRGSKHPEFSRDSMDGEGRHGKMGGQAVPRDASDQGVPSDASDQVAPSDAGDQAVPSDASGQAVPSDAASQGTPGGMGGQGARGGMGGFADGSDENCVVNISGGKLVIEAEGDALDSNGYVNLNGGEVYISGPTNSGNGSLDYVLGATCSGGTLIAAGAAGMASSFTEGTQGFALVQASGSAGDSIVVKDASGAELATFSPTKDFQCVVVTAPGMADGQNYTLEVNGQPTEFTATLEGSASMGARGGAGGFGGQRSEERPSGESVDPSRSQEAATQA